MEALIGHLPRTHTQLYSDMGAGCFKAFTFSDYSRDEDIKSVTQKMFTKLESGTCYRVKMAPLAGGVTSDAYVYCASSLFGVIHLQNHEGANYYGRLYNGTWTWDSYALKSDLNNIVTSENINPISFTADETKTLTVKTNCNDYVPYVVRERTSGKPLVVANFWLEASNVSKIILYAPLSITNANIDIYFIKRYW